MPRAPGLLRAARRDWPAAAAATLLVCVVVLALGAPWVTGYTYDRQDLDHSFHGPERAHWLGTDQYGRDLLARLLHGARVSLAVGGSAVAAESVLGVTWGTVAGFYGGRLDAGLMRIVDLLIAFPSLLLAVLVTGIFGSSLLNIVLALTMTAWPGMARTIRSEVVALRERDYIEAARAVGARAGRVLLRHLVPNAVHLLAARATLDVSALVLTEATLSFIGIGVQPPRPSWGLMINESFQYLQSHPSLVIIPATALSLTVVSFNVVGESLAERLDPRQRRRG
ncbi:MAG: ABC transporter permease [Bacillati bacterium ANGP1]|uniref:ABC transporter permease n=1 Tax=Candidatus Segetimicrobium genomatis TaxID=2569760 RepID=A0A537K4D4_9BACT|nr:MAG: ABC transporter permease [Terrabacteria group bacterium ANGP1]